MIWPLFELIWKTPWLLAIVILLIIVGIGIWIWEQIQESNEGDKLRKKERGRDSLWND